MIELRTPLGRWTQGKHRIRSKHMRFRHSVIHQYCLLLGPRFARRRHLTYLTDDIRSYRAQNTSILREIIELRTPLGRWTQGQKSNSIKQKCVFDILSFNNFVFSKQKTKLLDDKISKTHFFWSNSIFSLRPSPQRGSQFDDFLWNGGILSPVQPNVISKVC